MSLRHRFAPYIALLLLTLVLTYPTIVTLTTHVIDRQDPLLNTWIMAWEAHSLWQNPAQLPLAFFQTPEFFTTNIFYPLSNSLAFSEVLLSTSLIVMPLTWATGSAILSYNVAFLFAFFSTALGAYLLAYYLTGHRGAAVVAAVAFAWSPYRMGHLSQLQLLTFGWLPLALIYLDRLLRKRGVPLRNSVLFAFFFLLQALASFYSALFSTGACAIYVAGWLLWKRGIPRTALAGIALAAILTVIGIAPIASPYFSVQRTLGAGWTLEDNEHFSASLQAYAYAPEGTLFWDEITRPFAYDYGACCPPDSLFPGATLVALSAFAVWQARGGRRWLWLLLGIAAFVLSLGPSLTIQANQPTDITLPYKWLYENVFGFNAIRAPVRWAVLVTLALSLLAAIGVARLKWRWAWGVALGLVIAEFAVFPLRVVALPDAPPSLAWLAEQPPTRVLELPLAADRPTPSVDGADWQKPRRAWEQSRLLEMQYFSTFHWHTTLDGYSGYVPARHGDFARELASFPSERSLLMLRGLGIRYLVIHEADLSAEQRTSYAPPFSDGVREVTQIGDDRILELQPYGTGYWEGEQPTNIQAAYQEFSYSLPVTEVPANSTVTLPLIAVTSMPFVPPLRGDSTLIVRWKSEGGGSYDENIRLVFPPLLDRVSVLPLTLTTPAEGIWNVTIAGLGPGLGPGISLNPTFTVSATPSLSSDYVPVTLTASGKTDGNTYQLTWQTYQPLTRDYSVSARLVDEDGTVVASQDGPPGGDTPTSAWLAGEPYSATFELDAPDDAENLHLVVLWYDANRNVAAQVWDGEKFVDALNVPSEFRP